MSKEFTVVFQARWADMDFNGHMKNTSYLDYAADTRMIYFKQHGYSIADFKRLGFGPVVYEDTISYYQELFMYEEFSVNLMMKGMSQDGSRFYFVNDFRKLDGTAVATIHTKACWFDLEKRKIIAPPQDLLQIMNNIKKAPDFEIISNKRQIQ